MKDLSCLNTIIKDDLAVHIDLSNLNSWNLNSGFTSISLTKWSGAKSDNISLYDFGLTGFDNGRVNEMTDSLTLTPNDTKLKLFRVGFNNASGGTYYTGYGITGITGSSVGRHFTLSGGFLQGFFKLDEYNFEILPNRYGKGVTLETIIKVVSQSANNEYFLLLGSRAEDKYIPFYSGETASFTGSTGIITFSGVTTSEKNYLNSYTTTTVPKKAISNQYHTDDIEVKNENSDIDNNVVGFYISPSKNIGYTKINSEGGVESFESEKTISTGWTIITIVFKPYEIITDSDLLDCAETRKGDFYVFINGRKFWKITDFDEFYFRGFKNQKEKQLGVPFNVSWGGGSFGLRHSYHWELNERILFDETTPLGFGSGYTFVINPTITFDCPPAPISGYTDSIVVTGNNTTFNIVDPCNPSLVTGNTVLKIYQTGTTAVTTTDYYLEYNQDIQLISNRDYTFTVKVYDTGIFETFATGEIGLFFYGDVPIEIIEAHPYKKDVNFMNEWVELSYKIKLKNNTNKQNIRMGFYFKSDMNLVQNFILYFDNLKFVGSDKLVKDISKEDQKIETTFGNSFIGSIQKLRIYTRALSIQEVFHNAKIEVKNTTYA